MRAQSFSEGRKILVKYYSGCLKVGFILYEYVGIVSAFASYTNPPGARRLYSQTYFKARNHISWYNNVDRKVSMSVVVSGATPPSGPGPPHSQGL
jgi:hypothetical protein